MAYNRFEDYSNRFLCVLFRRARDIIGKSFDSDKIFEGIGMDSYKALSQQAREQAREEVVQFLQRLQRIEYDRTNNTVRLTREGLNWAKRECDKAPYTNYL